MRKIATAIIIVLAIILMISTFSIGATAEFYCTKHSGSTSCLKNGKKSLGGIYCAMRTHKGKWLTTKAVTGGGWADESSYDPSKDGTSTITSTGALCFGHATSSSGNKLAIVKKENDPEWTYSTIKFKEDEKDLNWYYSYFNNNECVLEKTNNILTFLYPFTTKGKTYTFTITPFAGCVETVSIVADYTSPAQFNNLEILENFSVSYEEKDDENGPKRIIKINSDPLSLFDNKDIIKYKQLCVNTYNANNEWVYNFGQNDLQYYALLNDGIDFMNENSNLLKTPEEFKIHLNSGDKIIINPHIQFNTRPYSETSGNFLFTFESKEFSYTKIN